MTWHCLVEVLPFDPVTNERVTLRLASADVRGITGLGGEKWVPALSEPPQTSIALFEGTFADAVRAGSARLPIVLERVREHYEYADRAYWPGAAVRIYAGRQTDPWPWALHFAGVVKTFQRERDTLGLGCEVDDSPFQKDVLTAVYAGTGDEEGGADLKGRPKPLIFGHARNVEPILIDAVNSVYQFSAYGPIEGVDGLFERASAFGPASANYASYDALVAATVPAGRWATCLNEGMIRLGAPAYGVITGDVRGHRVGGTTPRLTGAVIRAIASIAGISGGMLDSDTLDAMDTAAPYPINIVLTEQVRFLDIARRLALPCNHQCGIALTGKLFVTGIAFSGTSGQPRIEALDVTELKVSPPQARSIIGANRSWRVHSAEEIAFGAPIQERGAYDPSTTYRLGQIVTMPDRSEWIYVADNPGAGNAPPAWPLTANSWWSNTIPPITAADLTYTDGTPIEDLKPAQPGADVTGDNTSKDTDAVGGVPAEDVLEGIDKTLDDLALLEARVTAAQEALQAAQSDLNNLLGDVSALYNADADTNAAVDAARAQAQANLDQIAAAIVQAQADISRQREIMRDAGISVDPLTGAVRLHAFDRSEERLNQVDVRLDAVNADILLKASTTYVNQYVDQRITDAVFDPSQIANLDELYARVTSAEIAISGLDAAIDLRATLIVVEGVEARVTNAETAIDALEGQISTKVETSEFNALDTRVSSAETQIAALDGASIAETVRTARMLANDADEQDAAALGALLTGDRAKRDQVAAVAEARRELTVKITDDLTAEARSREQLAVRVGNVQTSVTNETLARIGGDQALAGQITTLSNSFGNMSATVITQGQAITTLQGSYGTLSSTVQALNSALGNVGAEVQQNAAAISDLTGNFATLSSTVSAMGSSAALNSNPGFDDYPSETVGAFPAGYVNGGGNPPVYRVPDAQGGYAMVMPGGAGQQALATHNANKSDQLLATGQWYMLEAEVVLLSGTFAGAGAILRPFNAANSAQQDLSISFAEEQPSPTVGQTYKFSKMVQVTLPGARGFELVAFSHWSVFGSIAQANNIKWERLQARPATSTEVRVIDQASAIATLNGIVAGQRTIGVDVNGRWTGIEIAGTPQLGGINLHADYVTITKPGSGARLVMTDGSIRVYDSNNVLRVRLGIW